MNKFNELSDTIIKSNQSYFITGPGGSGKTTLLKQIQSILTKQDKKHITLCPTNLAALLVDGITIHKFSTKLKKQSQVQSLDLDYIFIDEVSMIGEVFYKFLMTIKKIRPDIKFIISGDYNQLKPVNELAPIRHPAILALGLQLGDTGRSGSCPGDSNPTRSPGGGQRGVTSAARLQPGPATRGLPWPLPRGARPGSCRTPPSRGSDGGGVVEPRHPVYTCRVALRLGSPPGLSSLVNGRMALETPWAAPVAAWCGWRPLAQGGCAKLAPHEGRPARWGLGGGHPLLG